MTVTPAITSDLNELVVFARRIFDITFSPTNDAVVMKAYMDEAFTQERILAEFHEPGSVFLVAREEKVIIGYARIRKNGEANDQLGPSNLELQRFYIDPSFQGRGHAAVLFHHCLNQCKEVRWLWLGVWEHNPKAIRFYEKNGFEKLDRKSTRLNSSH